MAESQLSKSVRQLLRTIAPESGEDDFCLLDRFAHAGDEEAFEVLLKRHGPMVWRACRRIAHQLADAEDAFQATFLVLCRKARGIRKRDSLPGWLYVVACRIAAKANGRRSGLPLDENQLAAPNGDPGSDIARADERRFLDEALQKLPEKYRLPLLLCYFEGKTLRRAAAELGWADGTMATRLARGKELLRIQLTRRQVVISTAGLTSLLAQEASALALPRALLRATLKTKSHFLLGETAAAGGSAFKAGYLAEGILKAMLMTNMKTLTLSILLIGVLGAAAGIASRAALAVPNHSQETKPVQPLVADQEQPNPIEEKRSASDLYGDPLPEGAIARMGSMRLRHNHLGHPFSTAFTPDGKILASGGYEEIRLWDFATGKLLKEIKDGKRSIYCILAFSPDGQLLAGAGLHATSIWNWETGRLLHEFPTNGQEVVWSPDGKLLITSVQNKSVSIWDAHSGNQVAGFSPGGTNGGFYHLTLTPDGDELITLSSRSGKRLVRWDSRTGALRQSIELPTAPWTISPNGQTLVISSGDEKPLELWDTASGKERFKLSAEIAHQGYTVAFSMDSKILAVNRTDSFKDPGETSIALWNVLNGELLRTLRLPTRFVDSIGFNPDGRILLTSSSTGGESLIRLWDAVTGKPLLDHPGHTENILSMAFMPDGRSLVSGGLDGTVRLWDVASGRQIRELAGHRWRCDAVAITPDGKTILSGGFDGVIRFQDAQGNQIRRILLDGPPEEREKPLHNVERLALTPDGKSAATWSHDVNHPPAIYHIWEVATGKALEGFPRDSHSDRPYLSADGHLAVEPLRDNTASAPNGAPGRGGAKEGVEENDPGGRRKSGALIRDLSSGRELIRWMADANEFGPILAIAPDGRTLATIVAHKESKDEWRYDNTLHFWETASGKERLTISCGSLNHHIQRAAFAPSGRVLATAGDQGAILFWDLNTGKELPGRFDSEIVGHGGVGSLVFSADSRMLASGGADGTILVWKAPPGADPIPGPDEAANQKQLELWWTNLASDDARQAYIAVCGLSANPKGAVRLIRDHLKPVQAGPADKLQQFIADLNSPAYQKRESALKELATHGEQAGPALRTALGANPTAEQRRSIEKLLESFHAVPSGELLRQLRAVEALEKIGTSKAKDLLTTLAGGIPEARLTGDAKRSLERLGQRPPE